MGKMIEATYVGDNAKLVGKTTLLREKDEGTVLAQFDDVATGYGYGWHEFPKDAFHIREFPEC